MAKCLKKHCKYSVIWYTAFGQLFEKLCKHDPKKYSFFDPKFNPWASESWLLGCFGVFLGDVENLCFSDAVFGCQKIEKIEAWGA